MQLLSYLNIPIFYMSSVLINNIYIENIKNLIGGKIGNRVIEIRI